MVYTMYIYISYILKKFYFSQPKGADRKNKTDREKIEKRSAADKVSPYMYFY